MSRLFLRVCIPGASELLTAVGRFHMERVRHLTNAAKRFGWIAVGEARSDFSTHLQDALQRAPAHTRSNLEALRAVLANRCVVEWSASARRTISLDRWEDEYDNMLPGLVVDGLSVLGQLRPAVQSSTKIILIDRYFLSSGHVQSQARQDFLTAIAGSPTSPRKLDVWCSGADTPDLIARTRLTSQVWTPPGLVVRVHALANQRQTPHDRFMGLLVAGAGTEDAHAFALGDGPTSWNWDKKLVQVSRIGSLQFRAVWEGVDGRFRRAREAPITLLPLARP